MTATDHTPFLAAIRQSPDDDSVRLIYADWLDEHGEAARAEFIRIQCGLTAPWSNESGECWQCNCARNHRQHTNGRCRCAPDWKAMRRRERQLLDGYDPRTNMQHKFGWLGDDLLEAVVFGGASPEAAGLVWRRGFVYSIACTAADWMAHCDAILAAHPVREVMLTTWPAVISEETPFVQARCRLAHDFSSSQRDMVWLTVRRARTLEDCTAIIAKHFWPGITFHLPSRVLDPYRHAHDWLTDAIGTRDE